ncbi:MAG: hypothetical protein WDO69_00200 [Pseudomonadota bacterium]
MANLGATASFVRLGAWGSVLCAVLSFACSSSSPSSSSASSAGAGAVEAAGGASAEAGGAAAVAGQVGSAGAASLTSVTFHKDVEPILQRSCQSCHVAGGIAPFPLLTYAQAQAFGPAMVEQTKSRTMPPWHAQNTDECTVPLGWKNDTRLTDAEIATIDAWNLAGLPEGDAKDAPPPRELAPGLPGVQLELKPAAPFQLDPGGDQFRCFILDPKLDKDSFVNGVFVVPGNDAVVHHVLVFTDPNGKSLANADSSLGYDCFGGTGVADSQLLTAWTPGGIPMEYPSNIAVPLSAGTLLVMQVHYHPHSATDVTSDATRVQLRFSDSAPQYNAVNALIGNFNGALSGGDGLLPGPDDPPAGPAFLIPANASAHTETMQWTFKDDIPAAFAPRLYGIGGHMHYVGVDEKVTLTHADGSSACLMQIPHWDFDWQRRYDYDAPIDQLLKISAGDKLGIRCTYDNTMANQKVAASLLEQGVAAPRPVSLGETTLDEMCLVSVTALYPAAL